MPTLVTSINTILDRPIREKTNKHLNLEGKSKAIFIHRLYDLEHRKP